MISNEEKMKFDTLFEQADLDRDGFVSGHEIKNTFLKSGVAQPVLAHIWLFLDQCFHCQTYCFQNLK